MTINQVSDDEGEAKRYDRIDTRQREMYAMGGYEINLRRY